MWVEWDVQLYIRFKKAAPSRNGVRLHLTFLRLASLVGIGHEGPGEGPEGVQLYIRFGKASPPRNGVRLYLTFLRLASLVGIGHEIATPFFPPPERIAKKIWF